MLNVQFPKIGLNFFINPIAFKIGSLSVYWYGVILSVGFLLALLYGLKNCDRFGLDQSRVIDCTIVGMLCGIIGARAFYVIFYSGTAYIDNPISVFYIQQGGLAIYGGIIGSFLGAVIVAKLKNVNVPALLDLASIGFLIGQGIGRWGNFTNQEAFGTVTNLPWGMMSENTFFETVHPCFLYESIWCVLGFFILNYFSKRLRKYDGQIFLMYITWYGLERMFVEALRTDSLMIPGLNIRISQAIAVVTTILGVVLLIVFKNRSNLCVNKMHSTKLIENTCDEQIKKQG